MDRHSPWVNGTKDRQSRFQSIQSHTVSQEYRPDELTAHTLSGPTTVLDAPIRTWQSTEKRLLPHGISHDSSRRQLSTHIGHTPKVHATLQGRTAFWLRIHSNPQSFNTRHPFTDRWYIGT